jgi:hypothetical protein
VPLSRLRDGVDNEKVSQKLSAKEVDCLVRALHGIAGMDDDFWLQPPAGV